MSRHFGYRCVSHDPPLNSERWGNWGDDILRDIHKAHREGTLAMEPEFYESGPFAGQENYTRDYVALPVHRNSDHYTTTGPMHWLDDHPHCEVVLQDEYGGTATIEKDPS